SPEGERRQFLAAAASQHYLMKNYAKTAELAARYFRDGGTEKSVRTIYVQALYLGNDFAGAAKELMKDLEADERDNKAPTEEQSQLLANSCAKIKEAARHKRLKDMAAKNLAEDKKALARDDSQSAAGKDGRALFNEGFNYVLLGKPEQGLALMEKGIRDAKAFRRLEHAKLQLGYAY